MLSGGMKALYRLPRAVVHSHRSNGREDTADQPAFVEAVASDENAQSLIAIGIMRRPPTPAPRVVRPLASPASRVRMRLLPSCLLTLVLALGGCIASSGYSWDEVARVRAPDGRADAVLIETNGGATTSFGYHVYVVAPGAAVPRTARGEPGEAVRVYGATRNANAYGATLRWAGADTLAVEYHEASSDTLLHRAVTLAQRTVQVVLRPGVADASAPPGGMLYNLQGRPGDPGR